MNRIAYLTQLSKKLENCTGSRREAEVEARHLLSYVLNCEISDLYLKSDLLVDAETVRKTEDLLEKRLEGMPLAYVLGERWFMGLRFTVTPAVLIPRQDTELLAETAIRRIKENG